MNVLLDSSSSLLYVPFVIRCSKFTPLYHSTKTSEVEQASSLENFRYVTQTHLTAEGLNKVNIIKRHHISMGSGGIRDIHSVTLYKGPMTFTNSDNSPEYKPNTPMATLKI